MKRIRILTSLAVSLTTALSCSLAYSSSAVWSAPSRETIRQVRTAKDPRHILVLSSIQDSKWFLREVDSQGAGRLLVSGSGILNPEIPMSIPSYDGRHVILCQGCTDDVEWSSATDSYNSLGVHWYLVDCDLTDGSINRIAYRIDGSVHGTHRAISPDSRCVVFDGSDTLPDAEGRRSSGVWLYDKEACKAELIRSHLSDESSGFEASWTRDGSVYLLERCSGCLLRRDNQSLSIVHTLHPCDLADVSPDGSIVLMAKSCDTGLNIYMADLRSLRPENSFSIKADSCLNALGIDWSRDTKNAVLTTEDGRCVLVTAGTQFREVKGLPANWKPKAGVAFLGNKSLAIVDGGHRIVAIDL